MRNKNARRHLAKLSDGDARKCLNALEIGVLTTPPDLRGVIHFTLGVAEESIQQKAVVYDRAGDAHYDTISAFIKSMRGSDRKGAMYWLAKMLHAGEDFRFIARRIVIFASERTSGWPIGSAPTRHCHATSGRICRLTRSANTSRARHRLHVPRGEKPRSLRRAQRRNRKDRNGTNKARPGASQEQTFSREPRKVARRFLKGHRKVEKLESIITKLTARLDEQD